MKFIIASSLSVLLLASVSIQPIKADNPLSEIPITGKWANAQLFEDSVQSLYLSLDLQKYNLDFDAFRFGIIGYHNLVNNKKIQDKGLLTIIDFNKASTEKRFYTIDLKSGKIIFNTYVSHGKNTGENMAKNFSNKVHSNQSSLGFYVTAETYVGSKGYSLKLDGMDKGYNDNIRTRAVVMHEAEYVSEYWIKKYGRLGRSQGCPALPKALSKTIIDKIKGGTPVFAYYNDKNYLASSPQLNLENMLRASNAIASSSF